ncbi:MAG: flavodoxin [Muribaculaceae bacterium]|nr:flavodoxin [Muribaculaceae bacterium]
MKKIGIFYGSTTGTTAKVARKIGAALNVDPNDIHDVSNVGPAAVGEYELLLLGTSTWGNGEVQTDWYDFGEGMKALSLKGKKIAFFGCGNEKMKKTFCNGIERVYDYVKDTGADFIGEFNAEGYTFENSAARDEKTSLMRGLVLDEGNEAKLTDSRIKEWTALLTKEI